MALFGQRDGIKRPSLVDLILDRLQDEILGGAYGPGAPLPPERELAERYGVTRTSVKHALMKLESFGLIRIKHGIGSTVTDFAERGGADLLQRLLARGGALDRALLADLLEVRAILGGAMARLAAERGAGSAEPEQKDAMASLWVDLREMELALASPTKVQALENRFMRNLTRAGGNRAMKFLTNSLSAAYQRHLELFLPAFEDTRGVLAALQGILAAVEGRDGAKAGGAMEAYLRASGERMLAGLEEEGAA